QTLHEIGKLVRLELRGEREQLLLVEKLDERGSDGRPELEQDRAALVAMDEPPRRVPLLVPQTFEHERRVGRMQAIQLLLELDRVLALDERLHERVLARVSASHELIDERMTLEQRHHLPKRCIEVSLVLAFAAQTESPL